MSTTPSTNAQAKGEVKTLPLDHLHFDLTNPRYGPDAPSQQNDKDALDYIMSRFDMSDVLSSISVNGFFDSEPIVGLEKKDGSIQILEGNRRLAACLVLSNDPRAVAHKKKREAHPLRKGISLSSIPVMVYPEGTSAKQLLPYLGVRHIVGGRPWDSYAKAHWVAQTLASGEGLELSDIKAMLGDTRGLTDRLVTAYQVIQQLQNAELFDPDDSVKKGRGSATFPFSLIYNALDDRSLRRWLELPEVGNTLKADPIPQKRLADAASVVRLICGSIKENFPPSIKDNRQLSALSRAVQNPETFTQLKHGASVEDVEREITPVDERILDNLVSATPFLEDCVTVLAKSPLSSQEASRIHPTAQKLARLGSSVSKTLRSLADDEEDV